MRKVWVPVNYKQAWSDLKEVIEQREIEFEGNISTSDLLKVMDEIESDNLDD